jgi:hypothetical protein
VNALDLARWQFGSTTVYHFILVPLTIGLSLAASCLQAAWMINKDAVLPAHDQVLRPAVPDQLRGRRGDRACPGIPVRHELVGLLAVRPARATSAGLLEAIRGRATLLITHDLDGLDQVDEIIVLERGKVTERGTHHELAAADGSDQEMLAAQAGDQGDRK